jgi:hypothetical protein
MHAITASSDPEDLFFWSSREKPQANCQSKSTIVVANNPFLFQATGIRIASDLDLAADLPCV